MNSIRRYLLLLLLSIITLVTFFAAIQGYKASMREATALFDGELTFLTESVAQLPVDDITVLAQDSVAFQIWQEQLLKGRSSNAPTRPMTRFSEGFSEDNFSGKRWRILTRRQAQGDKWIMVAQPLEQRFVLAERMILSAMTPLIFTIPLLAIIIFVVLRQGLSPLTDLSNALRRKKGGDLQPVILDKVPEELAPVLDTLNQLFVRLETAFEREKRFAADAAHELRTPLSVLKINAHNLALELQQEQAKSSEQNNEHANMDLLQQGVERMSHVVDQILLLNRTTPEQFEAKLKGVNIGSLCQQVIASVYPEINACGQDIELQGEGAEVLGDEFTLGVMLQNLITNASKYGPVNGHILVTLSRQQETLVISVEDDGPGLPESEYQQVFERFYRVGRDRHNSGVIGCGLGLSIVKHIVSLHQGQIELGRSQGLGGLQVNIRLKVLS